MLLNGVTSDIDPETGKEKVTIVDVVGLIGAVVRLRVQHPRKLSGAEIKFIRDSLSVRAISVAKFLDITPEHFSRCENGGKVMSASSEKEFRLAAFLATLLEEPECLFVEYAERRTDACDLGEDPEEKALKFVKAFLSMKIEPAYDVDEEPLKFQLARGKIQNITKGSQDSDDDEWDTAA